MRYLILFSIIIIHSFIFTKLIYFPYPELFVYPYLTNHGLKPYSQIIDQHFPGLMFFPINLDNLGMTNAEIARIWSIIIVVIIHLMLFKIASEILKSKKKALLVNFLYLAWQPFFEGWVLWIDSFLPVILLPAFYAFVKKRIFITGLLLGIGVVFKQTLIPFSLIIILYLLWEYRKIKPVTYFLLGLFIPISGMFLYIFSIGALKDFLYWTIVFNLTVFARFGTSLPSSIGFVTRPILVYGASILLFFYKDKKIIWAVSIFLLGSLVGIFDRANFIHFQPSLPFALLATTLGIFSTRRNVAINLLIVGYLIIAIWWIAIFYKGHLSNKVLFFDQQTYALANKIKRYTRPGEKIFVFGAAPHLYQMSQTLPAGDVFVFQFPWFLQVAGDKILAGIKTDQPNIIVADQTVEIEGIKIIDFASQIDQYININYKKIDSVGTAEIMRRK